MVSQSVWPSGFCTNITIAGKLCVFIYSIFPFCPLNVHFTEAQQTWEKQSWRWLYGYSGFSGLQGTRGLFSTGHLRDAIPCDQEAPVWGRDSWMKSGGKLEQASLTIAWLREGRWEHWAGEMNECFIFLPSLCKASAFSSLPLDSVQEPAEHLSPFHSAVFPVQGLCLLLGTLLMSTGECDGAGTNPNGWVNGTNKDFTDHKPQPVNTRTSWQPVGKASAAA